MSTHATPKNPNGLVERPFDAPRRKPHSGMALLVERMMPGSDYRSCVKHLEAALFPTSTEGQTSGQHLQNAVDIFRKLAPEHQERILKVIVGEDIVRSGHTLHLNPENVRRIAIHAKFVCDVVESLPKDADGDVINTPYTRFITELVHAVDHELHGWANEPAAQAADSCTRALWALGYGYFPFWERRMVDLATQDFAVASLIGLPASESTDGKHEPSGWGLIKRHISDVAPAVFSISSAEKDGFIEWLKKDPVAYSSYIRAILADESTRPQAVEMLLSSDWDRLRARFNSDIAACLAANPSAVAVQFAFSLVSQTEDPQVHFTVYDAFANTRWFPSELVMPLCQFSEARRVVLEPGLELAGDEQFAAVGELIHLNGLLSLLGNPQGAFRPLMARAGAEMLDLVVEPRGSVVTDIDGTKMLIVHPSKLKDAEDQRARAIQYLAKICMSGIPVTGVNLSMTVQDDGSGHKTVSGFALHIGGLLPLVGRAHEEHEGESHE